MLFQLLHCISPRTRHICVAGLRTVAAQTRLKYVPSVRAPNAIARSLPQYDSPETTELLQNEKAKSLFKSGQIVNVQIKKFIPIGAIVSIADIDEDDTTAAVSPQSDMNQVKSGRNKKPSIDDFFTADPDFDLSQLPESSLEPENEEGLLSGDQLDLIIKKRGYDVVVGEYLQAYVSRVQEDGKIDVSIQPVGVARYRELKDRILQVLKESPTGTIPIGDKSSSEAIEAYFGFGVSKRDFKNAVGMLYKEKCCEPTATEIKLIESSPKISQKAAVDASRVSKRHGNQATATATVSATASIATTATTTTSTITATTTKSKAASEGIRNAQRGASDDVVASDSKVSKNAKPMEFSDIAITASSSSSSSSSSSTTAAAASSSSSSSPAATAPVSNIFIPNRIRNSVFTEAGGNAKMFHDTKVVTTYFLTKFPLSFSRDELQQHIVNLLPATAFPKPEFKEHDPNPSKKSLLHAPGEVVALRVPRYPSGNLKGFAFLDVVFGKLIVAKQQQAFLDKLHMSKVKESVLVCEISTKARTASDGDASENVGSGEAQEFRSYDNANDDDVGDTRDETEESGYRTSRSRPRRSHSNQDQQHHHSSQPRQRSTSGGSRKPGRIDVDKNPAKTTARDDGNDNNDFAKQPPQQSFRTRQGRAMRREW